MKAGSEIYRSLSMMQIMHQNFPRRQIPIHSHTEHQLFMPLSGTIEVSYMQAPSHRLSAGTMLYIPGSHPHGFECVSAHTGEQLIIMVTEKPKSPNDLAKMLEAIKMPCLMPASQLIKELVFFILTRKDDRNSAAIEMTLLMTLLESLEVSSEPLTEEFEGSLLSSTNPSIQRALSYIREHHFKEILLSDIAKAAQTSERSIGRLFQAEVGMSPKQYLIRYRIYESMRLLRSSSMSVTDVAFEVGFGSLSRFINTFRLLTGKVPSDFRVAK